MLDMKYRETLDDILLFRYGLGPVPDTYFANPEQIFQDYDQLTTVYAGETLDFR